MLLCNVPEELAPYATEYAFALRGVPFLITRYDNHMHLIGEGKWVVNGPSREMFLCHGEWAYKRYQSFETPGCALAALKSIETPKEWIDAHATKTKAVVSENNNDSANMNM